MAVSANEIQRSSFNPNEHIMQIGKGDKAKDYLPVQWRLVWFRSLFPQGQIETETVLLDLETEFTIIESKWNNNRRCYEDVPKTAKGIAIFKARVSDGVGGVATGTKSEKAASFDDFIEKAETGAIGRALAALGYGTQFTGEEWDEAHRIVDSPVDHQSEPKKEEADMPISEQQLGSIRKLCEHLSKPEPENSASLTFLEARSVIQQLTTEYKEIRQNGGVPLLNEVAAIRKRVIEIKPSMKKGDQLVEASFEDFYAAVTGKKFVSPGAVICEDLEKMTVRLDAIVHTRKNKQQPAAS